MRLEICLYLLYREHRERGQEGTKDRGEGRHTDARDARDTRDARDKEERDERRGPELKESRLDATVRKYLKGTVSRDWIGPFIVLMDRPKQAHVSCRFSYFLIASSLFNSNNCSRIVFAKNWRLCTQLAASACKIRMRLAA